MKKILLVSAVLAVMLLSSNSFANTYYGYGYYQPYPLYTGIPGSWGNDTESTLYLRPLNNAMIGPAAFGSGYPQSPLSYSYAYYPERKGSGILQAVRYLSARGELDNSANKERQQYMEYSKRLLNRIERLEKKIDDLQKAIEKKKEVKKSK